VYDINFQYHTNGKQDGCCVPNVIPHSRKSGGGPVFCVGQSTGNAQGFCFDAGQSNQFSVCQQLFTVQDDADQRCPGQNVTNSFEGSNTYRTIAVLIRLESKVTRSNGSRGLVID
jgi:hypothetical protein